MTLQKQTSQNGADASTSCPGVSPANPSALPGNAKVRRMNATCGLTCLEQYKKSGRATWWGKMFAESLVGTGAWYSSRCKLTWKLKDTPYSRLYFQLQPSPLPIEERGCGLWPTPTAVQRDHPERVEGLLAKGAQTMMSRKNGENRPNSVLDMALFVGLLPTPKATEIEEYYEDWRARMVASGNPKNVGKLTCNLGTMARSGMLPTPAAADGLKTTSNSKQTNLNMLAPVGASSQLNPLFVAEMMGFPPSWTVIPFLNGDPKA